MTKALSVLHAVLMAEAGGADSANKSQGQPSPLDQRTFHRMMVNWLQELNSPSVIHDTTTFFGVLTAFANLFHRLLLDLFQFLEPCLAAPALNDTIRLFYKGC